MGQGSHVWTEACAEELTALAAKGYSASQIARQLGPEFSRNQVIGKIHRLGLPWGRRETHARSRSSAVAKPAPKVQPIERIRVSAHSPHPAPAANPDGSLLRLEDLRAGQCRWPHGDPLKEGFHFCGLPSSGDPYCEHHQARSRQPKAEAA